MNGNQNERVFGPVAVGRLLVVAIAYLAIWWFYRYTPRASDGATLLYEACLERKGLPTYDGWTGNITGCVGMQR
jgi:hypothetical protein